MGIIGAGAAKAMGICTPSHIAVGKTHSRDPDKKLQKNLFYPGVNSRGQTLIHALASVIRALDAPDSAPTNRMDSSTLMNL